MGHGIGKTVHRTKQLVHVPAGIVRHGPLSVVVSRGGGRFAFDQGDEKLFFESALNYKLLSRKNF